MINSSNTTPVVVLEKVERNDDALMMETQSDDSSAEAHLSVVEVPFSMHPSQNCVITVDLESRVVMALDGKLTTHHKNDTNQDEDIPKVGCCRCK